MTDTATTEIPALQDGVTLADRAPRRRPPRKRKPAAKPKRRAKPLTAEHSSESHDWGSARVQVDLARVVLGHITVDPFSSAKWNQVIGARRIITEAQDGYQTPWIAGAPFPQTDPQGDDDGAIERRLRPNTNTAMVNPPGDPSGEKVKRAWRALELYHRRGWFGGGAVWIGFNLNQFQTLQDIAREDGYRSPLSSDFLRCVPESRLPYQSAPGVDGGQPPRPSWMLLMPSLDRRVAMLQRTAWGAIAGRLGEVW